MAQAITHESSELVEGRFRQPTSERDDGCEVEESGSADDAEGFGSRGQNLDPSGDQLLKWWDGNCIVEIGHHWIEEDRGLVIKRLVSQFAGFKRCDQSLGESFVNTAAQC